MPVYGDFALPSPRHTVRTRTDHAVRTRTDHATHHDMNIDTVCIGFDALLQRAES